MVPIDLQVLYSVPPREALEDKLPPIDERRTLERKFKAVAVRLQHALPPCCLQDCSLTAAVLQVMNVPDGRPLWVQAAQERSERQGVGVSKEGQQLFDCFYKTMPCKWQGKTILVLGEVPPISWPVHRTTCEHASMMAKS